MPAHWPGPTARWIRENALWQPPEGWSPLPDLAPSPSGWQFWLPNPQWYAEFAPNYRRIVIWKRLGTFFALVWLGVAVIGLLSAGSPAFAIVALLAACASGTCLMVHAALQHRVTRRGMQYLRGIAAGARGEHLIRLYQRYLRDSA